MKFFQNFCRKVFRQVDGGRWALIPAVVFLSALPLSGCDGSPDAAVDRAESRNAAFPTRIVSLVPSVTETLFELGAGDRVVGVSSYCRRPPEAASRPRVGSFLEPVAEAVVALEPDLVLTMPTPGNRGAVQAMERVGVSVEVVRGDASVADVLASIRQTADLVGLEEAGESLVGRIEEALRSARERNSGKDRPGVALVVGLEPLVLAGPESYLGELLEAVGARNIADLPGGRWPRMGWEALAAAVPDVIVDLSMGSEAVAPDASPSSRWQRLAAVPAVRHGRVRLAPNSLLLPGPGLAEAVLALERLVHGEG